MNMQNKSNEKGQAGMLRAWHGTPDKTPYVAGRRANFKYRDFLVAQASGGKMKAQIMEVTDGMKETGWHYHTCEAQFNFILEGWADLVMEDGTEIHLEAGDCMFIPGGLRHNELRSSNTLRSLEVTVP